MSTIVVPNNSEHGRQKIDAARQQLAAQFAATWPKRPASAADHLLHLIEIQARLLSLHDAALKGDAALVLSMVNTLDLATLIDEWKPVVGRYRYEVRRHARRIIRNLRRPYMHAHHVLQLEHLQYMLEGALKESPVLIEDADAQVAVAWEREIAHAQLTRKAVRELTPIVTLDGLNAALVTKLEHGRMLERSNPAYQACERVAYF